MENISPPATPEVAHLHLAVFPHEDETISRPRRRRRHPNGVQLPPPRTSTDEDENNDICPVAGQQFVEYFTTRRANKGARWCIFLCWEESHGNFVKTVDVPLTADEREDEKKVFERIRLTFDQRRGFIRRWLYESIPEQAKVSLTYPCVANISRYLMNKKTNRSTHLVHPTSAIIPLPLSCRGLILMRDDQIYSTKLHELMTHYPGISSVVIQSTLNQATLST